MAFVASIFLLTAIGGMVYAKPRMAQIAPKGREHGEPLPAPPSWREAAEARGRAAFEQAVAEPQPTPEPALSWLWKTPTRKDSVKTARKQPVSRKEALAALEALLADVPKCMYAQRSERHKGTPCARRVAVGLLAQGEEEVTAVEEPPARRLPGGNHRKERNHPDEKDATENHERDQKQRRRVVRARPADYRPDRAPAGRRAGEARTRLPTVQLRAGLVPARNRIEEGTRFLL